jgi:TonB family protein
MSARMAGVGLLLAGLCGCASAPTGTKAVDVAVPSPTAVETRLLIQALSAQDPEIRTRSAWYLAGATELQGEARPALMALRSDREKTVRYAAEWALMHLRKGQGEPDSADAGPTEPGWTPPKPTVSPRPQYPQAAFDAKVEGTVLVEILIGEEGEVAHVEIRQSIPALDAAALATVRQWKFEPARVDGAPRATVAHIPVAFRIY